MLDQSNVGEPARPHDASDNAIHELNELQREVDDLRGRIEAFCECERRRQQLPHFGPERRHSAAERPDAARPDARVKC